MQTPGEILSQMQEKTGLVYPFAPVDLCDTLTNSLHSKILMAPMAGVTDASYRMMARAGGADLAYTEMVSVAGIHYASDKTWELVEPNEYEGALAVQLFGSEPAQFSEAAAAVQKRLRDKLALLDINMACPVPKVFGKGEGSALMGDPERAEKIVQACCAVVDVPVTVKIRAGITWDAPVAPEFALRMQNAGASAVAIHGRSRSQMYNGQANRSIIAEVKQAVDVPVIGSGDVFSADDVAAMMRQTGCDGVFCARGTYGNPWIFSDAQNVLVGKSAPLHDAKQRLEAFICHVALLQATGAHIARARNLAGWYVKGIPGAAGFRKQAVTLTSAEEFIELARCAQETLEDE